MPRRQALLETLLIFAVFFLHGAWPAPDVNEPCYLGKAIRFWNPHWAAGDFFLDSADSHQVFYVTFGWLSLAMGPAALAWTGRVLTWSLLAWAWQRLSAAVTPRPWVAVVSGTLLAVLNEYGNLAGEWVVGGVEAKGFAWVFVVLALEALVCNRWNRAWLLLGLAAMFHVLVGGWAIVAAGVAWLWQRPGAEKGDSPHLPQQSGDRSAQLAQMGTVPAFRPTLRSMLPALGAAFVLSLPSLVPALLLNTGAAAETVRRANVIYVFQRLHHHLSPLDFPASHWLRFGGLTAVWLILYWFAFKTPGARRLGGFVLGALAVAGVGLAAAVALRDRPELAAAVLRYYWFRLADVAVPLGAALGVGRILDALAGARPRAALAAGLVAAGLLGAYVGGLAVFRCIPTPPRADESVDYVSWRLACNWIVQSGQVPADAVFFTPLGARTFKWYTGRGDVANFKDVPQDAASIVAWWERLAAIHGSRLEGDEAEDQSATEAAHLLSLRQLRELGTQYGAEYVIAPRSRRLPPLTPLYRNRDYAIYRLTEESP